jgi:hypothetical protein
MRSPPDSAFEPFRAWRCLARLLVGAVAAAVLVAIGGLLLRTEPPRTGPGNPVAATAEDASFRLTLTTPRVTYGLQEVIEPVATATYLGPRPTETLFHAAYPIGFQIEEVGGERGMGGGMEQPCLRTELANGEAAVLPFAKAGSPDDPRRGFDRAWYEDPVLRLPQGTWRIIAYFDVSLGDCGGERHQLTVENIVVVK